MNSYSVKAQNIKVSGISRYFDSRTLVQQNLGSPIELSRFIKENFIYSSQGSVYMNLDQIQLLNTAISADKQNGNILKINDLVIEDEDFYLMSELGVFKNFKKIFGKEECFHLEKSSKKIFISCLNGIYSSEINPHNPYENYNWRLYEGSPVNINYFTLNSSKSNPEYASSANGFYYYDSRKHKWLRRNQNINRDFKESYSFGRFLVETINKQIDRIYLPCSIGLMVSNDNGKTWIKNNKGLDPESTGFHGLREIKKYYNSLLLASSTGLYISSIDKIDWQKITIDKCRKDENLNENIYSIDIKFSKSKNKGDLIIVSNSEGQIIGLEENFTQSNNQNLSIEATSQIQSEDLISSEQGTANLTLKANAIKKENDKYIKDILSFEPKIQELQQVAIAMTGIPTGKQFNRYRKQARVRNLLPELETSANKGIQNYISIESAGKDSYSSGTSSISSSQDQVNVNRDDNQINTGLKLSWNFGNLIYDPEINDINTSARLTANIRENLLNEITQIYFQRKELLYKLLNDRLSEDNDDSESLDYSEQIKFEEFTAQLDARTESWFSDRLAQNFKELEKIMPEDITTKIKDIYHGISI